MLLLFNKPTVGLTVRSNGTKIFNPKMCYLLPAVLVIRDATFSFANPFDIQYLNVRIEMVDTCTIIYREVNGISSTDHAIFFISFKLHLKCILVPAQNMLNAAP